MEVNKIKNLGNNETHIQYGMVPKFLCTIIKIDKRKCCVVRNWREPRQFLHNGNLSTLTQNKNIKKHEWTLKSWYPGSYSPGNRIRSFRLFKWLEFDKDLQEKDFNFTFGQTRYKEKIERKWENEEYTTNLVNLVQQDEKLRKNNYWDMYTLLSITYGRMVDEVSNGRGDVQFFILPTGSRERCDTFMSDISHELDLGEGLQYTKQNKVCTWKSFRDPKTLTHPKEVFVVSGLLD